MLTNRGNISLSLAVWLAADSGYDLAFDPLVYSATELLDPIRSIVLTRRLKEQNKATPIDISDLVQSRMGTAIHDATEMAWLRAHGPALLELGYPQEMIDRIQVNPKEETDPDGIYIYLEKRSQREIDGVIVSGKFDRVEQGRVKDIKTTQTYNWIKGDNVEKYRKQGSIYRWLNQDIITDDLMDVEYLFTDWKQYLTRNSKDYPPKRIMTKTIPLMSVEETERWVRQRLAMIRLYETKPQEELPECTPQELWMAPSKWKYYRDPTKTSRATKNFDTQQEAVDYQAANGGVGLVIEFPSEPKFCNYCKGRAACTQAESFVDRGLLTL